MKKLTLFTFLMFVVISVNTSFAADAENVTPEVNWKIFGKNLEKALLSDNDGLQQSAMQMVIRYGDNLNVGQGVLEILRTYRSDNDLQTRRLALAALPKTGSKLAMGYLQRAGEFEKSPVLKKQIEFILAEKK